ncbi:MAG: chemotaxis protein CheW [bacterium]
MSHPDVTSPTPPAWDALGRETALRLRGESVEASEEIPRELLVFGLDRNAYAVPVERVREIIRMRSLTRVPRAPAWLLGVVALRGEIVEVIDLRRKLGLPTPETDRASRILVLHDGEDRVTGVLVDSVSEVHRVAEREILPPQGFEIAAVVEMFRREDGFVSILDVDRALEVRHG